MLRSQLKDQVDLCLLKIRLGDCGEQLLQDVEHQWSAAMNATEGLWRNVVDVFWATPGES
jgi:hypothetical protein